MMGTPPIFMILLTAQRNYMEIYTEFHQNRSINMEIRAETDLRIKKNYGCHWLPQNSFSRENFL